MNRNRFVLIAFYVTIGLAFSGASFSLAWYNSATNLRITTIDITLDTERDLKISTAADGEFVSDLHQNNFPDVGKFTPVSTNFSSTWIERGDDRPTFYDMSYISNGNAEISGKNLAERGYFCQDIYLEADDDVYVGVDVSADATYFKSNLEKNANEASILYAREGKYTQEEYERRLNEVQYSGRIALLDPHNSNFMILDPYKGEDPIYFGGPLDNDKDGFYDNFYSLDRENKEVFYGECEKPQNLVYDEASPVDIEAVGEKTCFNAGHKAGVKILNVEKSIENGADIAIENSVSPAMVEARESLGKLPDFYVALDAYKPKKLNLSFYLEGWDSQSINGTMGGSFDMKVTFKILRER